MKEDTTIDERTRKNNFGITFYQKVIAISDKLSIDINGVKTKMKSR